MQVETELQPMFHYAIWPFFVLALIIAGLIFLLKHKPKKKPEPVKIELNIPKRKTVSTVKQEHLVQIKTIKEDYNNKKISERKAFQKLSVVVRDFVYETTGIEVQKYTLRDIKTLKMPELSKLVESYYSPEFSKDSEGDIQDALDKTRELIEKWN